MTISEDVSWVINGPLPYIDGGVGGDVGGGDGNGVGGGEGGGVGCKYRRVEDTSYSQRELGKTIHHLSSPQIMTYLSSICSCR